jgi:hypothetical protein
MSELAGQYMDKRQKKLLARILSVIGLIIAFLSIARQNDFWPF